VVENNMFLKRDIFFLAILTSHGLGLRAMISLVLVTTSLVACQYNKSQFLTLFLLNVLQSKQSLP
jgi:hypothetical protein